MSIANPHFHGSNPAETANIRLKKWAAVASLSVATVLITIKLFAFLVTDSVSLLTSLMDSTFDAFASAVAMFSIIHAMTPADEEHRYGHGKLEALAGIAQSLFIFGSAAYVLMESLHRFIHPKKVESPETGIVIVAISLALTGGLVLFQKFVIRRTQSIAISADHLHYKGDLFMNLGVFTALALSHYSPWPYFDPVFGGGIALLLLFGARDIARQSIDVLMDKELSEEDRKRIETLVRAHPAVVDIHDLRTRHSGQHAFIEFHLEMDGAMTLAKAHDVTEEIEKIIYDAFPKSEVLIHQEPAGLDDHRLDDLIKN